MRGENDNVTFSGFMKVDHYDAETGRIYLKTDDIQPRQIAKSHKIGMSLFIVANVLLGLFYQHIVNIIDLGLKFL